MAARNVAKRLIELREHAGLSRNALARLAGYSRGTSLQHYEKAANWEGKRFPVDFVARIAPALIGKGEPPIVDRELWELAPPQSEVIVTRSTVVAIPVIDWSALRKGRTALKSTLPAAFIEAVGLSPKDYLAVVTQTDFLGGQVPRGSHLILDPEDIELRDGRRYVIIWNEAPTVRRYYSNPARFESDASPREETLYPSGPVEIIARIVRAVIDF